MNLHKALLLVAAASVVLGGCAQVPTGPAVAVMPAPNKPFEVFRAEDAQCRQYARAQISAGQGAAQDRAVGSAVAGTALGAAAGALLGQSGEGAAAGAGVGLLVGSASGAGGAGEASMSLQRRYDIAYEQCMYAKGNQVPGYGWQTAPAPPPPANYPPPPPANYPSPPPAG